MIIHRAHTTEVVYKTSIIGTGWWVWYDSATVSLPFFLFLLVWSEVKNYQNVVDVISKFLFGIIFCVNEWLNE